MALTTTLLDVIRRVVERDRDALHVSLPAKVVRFDSAKCLVDLTIAVRHRIEVEGETEFEDYPTLVGVPLVWQRSKDYIARFPVAVGDRCMVHFADPNLAEWREAGDGAESSDPERHGFGGAWATLGGYPDSDPWVSPGPPITGPTIEHKTGARLQVTEARVECGRIAPLPLPTLASVMASIAAVNAAILAIQLHVTAMPTGTLAPTPFALPSPAPPPIGTTKFASE